MTLKRKYTVYDQITTSAYFEEFVEVEISVEETDDHKIVVKKNGSEVLTMSRVAAQFIGKAIRELTGG